MVSYNSPIALFTVINQLTTQVLAACALGRAPASYWLDSSEAEQRRVTGNEGAVVVGVNGGRPIDKLTTSDFYSSTRLDANAAAKI